MSDLDPSHRAVACPGWRWLAGMLADRSGPWSRARVVMVSGGRILLDGEGRVGDRWTDADGYLPDLTDPCTIGALLALYDERRRMKTCPDPVYTAAAVYGLMGRETVEALVAALEAP